MRNEIIVQKMYRYAVKLMEYCEEYTYNAFIADMKTVEACVFNLSQLGSCAALWTFPLPRPIPKFRGGRCTDCEIALSTTMKG